MEDNPPASVEASGARRGDKTEENEIHNNLLYCSGLASSTARMVTTIHLVTQGRAVNNEDNYGRYYYSCPCASYQICQF